VTARHVVKLGGCLVTEKDGFCEPNYPCIAEFGQQVQLALAGGIALPIIVLGGGSFGNGIPARYGLTDPKTRKSKDIGRMTFGMFTLMQAVATTWRAIGLPTYPVQASAVISYGLDGYELDPRLFQLAINMGLIPLVTGDLLLDGPINIYSSDLLPELLVRHFDVHRVVMLTDVAGLIDRSDMNEKLVETVRPGEAHVTMVAGASSKVDVTGGMKTKVDALNRLLDLGISSVIADGRVEGQLLSVLRGDDVAGTNFISDPR
jgi:isopentenyl phosphate kinase